MTLSEMVHSKAWNPEIEATFKKQLKRSPSNFHKAQNCTVKALHIYVPGDAERNTAALHLIDFAIENYCQDNFDLARAYSAQGRIHEDGNFEYQKAFESYSKWADLKTNFGGHEFDRVRSFLRANHLKPTTEFKTLFLELQNKLDSFPTKMWRFWMAMFSATLYDFEGNSKDAKRMAKTAYEILKESKPTLLNRTFPKLKNVEDSISITLIEERIVKKMAGRWF